MKWALLLLSVLRLNAACVIQGTVVDLESGKSIAKAKVYAKPEDRSAATMRTTDDRGVFCFDQLQPDSYKVVADLAGYLPALYGARPGDDSGMPVKVEDAAEAAPLVLKMTRAVSITGVALHADGEPLDNATIDLFRKGWDHGWKAIFITNSRSDDQGHFRFGKLALGNYYVGVRPNAYPENTVVLDEKGQPVNEGERMMYYSSSSSFERATPVALKPGQEAVLTLTLGAVGLRHLSGRVAGFSPTPQMRTELQLDGEDIYIEAPIRPDGTFSVGGLLPEHYTAFVDDRGAKVEVDLSKGDVEGLMIGQSQTFDIELTARVEDQPARKANVSLDETEGRRSFSPRPGPCCTFHRIPSGLYRLEASFSSIGDKAYVKTVLINGHAQLDALLDLRNGMPGTIEAVLSAKLAEIEGETDATNRAPSDLAVTVVVVDSAISKVEISGQSKTLNTTGKFSFTGLAPGHYRVFAIEGFQEEMWGSPELAAALASKSLEIDLVEGERKKIKLPVISSEAWTAALRKIGM